MSCIHQTEQTEDALTYFTELMHKLTGAREVNFRQVAEAATAARICNDWLNDLENTDDLATYFANEFEETDCWDEFSPLTIVEMRFSETA